ncbi:MAG: XRE family transcriptional regulator [Pseudonocardiaceae bacterium]
MTEANDQFRAARERTASPTHQGLCLTRQELAEMVNTWVWEHHNKKVVVVTAHYIGRLETGIIRWPTELYREALRAILSVPKDSDLGFVNARSRRAAVRLERVDRQNLIRGGIALSVSTQVQGPVAALLEYLEGSKTTRSPKRVGASDIKQIRNVARVYESWRCAYGGESVRDAVMGQLSWSAGLLNATCPKRLRPELLSALGDFADVAGFIAVDAGAHEEARQVYGFALARAEEAEDWTLRAEVLSSMAKQAIWTGQPDEGLTLAELALVRSDRLTSAVRALLHTDRGRALAKMRRVQETLTAIGTADHHFAHVTPDNEPPFMACYNNARHAQLTGQPLADLAILGHDHNEATDRLTAAAAGHTDGSHRAVCLTKLANLTMATGDPLQAAIIGHEALEVAGTIRSRVTDDALRDLSQYAAAHQNLDEVAHLRHRINTLLVGADSP